MRRLREHAITTGLALAVGLAFWAPALGVSRGYFPAPLDDVYIHFDFARSLGQGRPFQWIAGQGYSSGETAPLYAVVLAVGWVVGFRGRALGVWAALVAIASVASLLGSVRRLVRPCPPLLAWVLAVTPLAIGVVDWALFSGMEVALFSAGLGRALEALARTRERGPGRSKRQWRLGAWGAALVLLRPEAVVVVGVLAVIAARGAGRRSGLLAVARAALPGMVTTGAVLGANFLGTGDARSAGAQLKLLSSNPYMSDVDRARVFVENLVTFWVKVVRGELAVAAALLFVLPLLALIGLATRAHRSVAAACILSALGWTLLVSWNGNAPFHNFRYYAPALILLGVAAALGIATLARHRRVALAVAAFTLGVTGAKIPAQVVYFRSASANIRDQHIEVGERLARLPDARVLLGDAGAIPYVSGRTAIDALGLGGYRGVPFAHAAVHGEAATIELIERLDPALRPTHFALYPSWFAGLTSRFGTEIDRVTITNNVICGSPTKAIYRADWSALDLPRPGAHLDEIDVGDVIAEAEHGYVPPLPHGGWTTLDILADAGVRRFDGGRTIPDGARETFVARRGGRDVVLRVRIDAPARGIVVRTARVTKEMVLEPPVPGAWRSATVALDAIDPGETIALEARGSEYRDYHVWIDHVVRAASPPPAERDIFTR